MFLMTKNIVMTKISMRRGPAVTLGEAEQKATSDPLTAHWPSQQYSEISRLGWQSQLSLQSQPLWGSNEAMILFTLKSGFVSLKPN